MKRFPVGLTLAALLALGALISLGVWQLNRLAETTRNRERIAALSNAPAVPLARLLATTIPLNLDHRRIVVDCQPARASAPVVYRYAIADGVVSWRLLTMCALSGGPFDGILLDRGLVATLSGVMAPNAMRFPGPATVTGVSRVLGASPLFGDSMPSGVPDITLLRVLDPRAVGRVALLAGLSRPAPYYLVVESEQPAVAGVKPSPVVEDVPRDNFGYALTWFGLAGALACVYAAFLWRRLSSR